MSGFKYETITPISAQLPFKFTRVFKNPPTFSDELKSFNWHINLELIYCEQGTLKAFCDGRDYTINQGEMMVVNPDTFHGTFAWRNCVFYVLIIDPDFCHANGIFPEKERLMEFVSDNKAATLFESLISNFNAEDKLRIPKVRLALLDLLIYLYSSFESEQPQPKSSNLGNQRIKVVLTYINEHYREKITLKEIANQVKVSESHISHEFKKFMGCSIIEHINLVRCLQAQKLIRGNMNVSEAATLSGFENLSYFTRTYKKHLGNLPSEDLKK